MTKKVMLKCVRTNGRWSKNDVATFDEARAKELTAGNGPHWVVAKAAGGADKKPGGADVKPEA